MHVHAACMRRVCARGAHRRSVSSLERRRDEVGGKRDPTTRRTTARAAAHMPRNLLPGVWGVVCGESLQEILKLVNGVLPVRIVSPFFFFHVNPHAMAHATLWALACGACVRRTRMYHAPTRQGGGMAERVLLFVSALAGLGIIGHALPNGFGERPGMGWEGDYQDPKALGPGRGNSSYIADIASFIATQQVDVGGGRRATLQQLGYFYVNPSSSWDEFNRSASGQLVPNHLLYPHGIESTVDHIHVLGLSYGTYTDRGRLDCDKRPGELGHEKQDAEYFASIGVDWVKDDSCYDSGDEDTAIAHYAAFRDALNATGRKIWYALCGWEPWYASHTGGGNALANSARIGPDTGGGWTAVKKNIDNCKGIGQYAGAHNNGGYWCVSSMAPQ